MTDAIDRCKRLLGDRRIQLTCQAEPVPKSTAFPETFQIERALEFGDDHQVERPPEGRVRTISPAPRNLTNVGIVEYCLKSAYKFGFDGLFRPPPAGFRVKQLVHTRTPYKRQGRRIGPQANRCLAVPATCSTVSRASRDTTLMLESRERGNMDGGKSTAASNS